MQTNMPEANDPKIDATPASKMFPARAERI